VWQAHSLLLQRERVEHTHRHKYTHTFLGEKRATFSFTVNIIFYCTINTKMARYFALAENGFITWNCFSWWHKRQPTQHTLAHMHTLTHDWAYVYRTKGLPLLLLLLLCSRCSLLDILSANVPTLMVRIVSASKEIS